MREAADRKDAVIFIPGMLGSKLMHPRSGSVIWGEGHPSVAALALDEWAPPAKAEILEEYWRDLHEVVAQTLDEVLRDKKLLFRFAYDWRHGIDRIAQWFDERIQSAPWREELKDKTVHIIGHSMGGLVAGRWKHLYHANEKARYPFDLASIVVLRSPAEGSCGMLYMLLSGYGRAVGASDVLNWGLKRFFETAHAAAFTFPSVFQSLPAFDPDDADRSCVVADRPPFDRGGRDHFSLSLWETALVPHLGRRSCYLVASCSVWDDSPGC
jgi:pimeloyl-ACP methyl ester carboxylesterase